MPLSNSSAITLDRLDGQSDGGWLLTTVAQLDVKGIAALRFLVNCGRAERPCVAIRNPRPSHFRAAPETAREGQESLSHLRTSFCGRPAFYSSLRIALIPTGVSTSKGGGGGPGGMASSSARSFASSSFSFVSISFPF